METTTIVLLDRWKAHKGIQTDTEAARRLHVTAPAVSNWRHGRSHAEPVLAAQMAEDLHLDVLSVLASIEADRARSPETRRLWARFGKPAFMALLVGFTLAPPPEPALAKADPLPHIAAHYAKSPRRRRRPIACVNQQRFSGGWVKQHLSVTLPARAATSR